MFGSKKSKVKESVSTSKTQVSPSSGLNSLVKGTIIEGTIKSESDIRIDGYIKGDLQCKARVIIGPHGSVNGTINCVNALIEGKFDGKLMVKELLHVKETGILNAEVKYGKLSVDPGAIYNGTSLSNNSSKPNSGVRSSKDQVAKGA